MKTSKTLLLIALLSLAALSHAQNYPTKAVRIVVGFAPGGSTDLTARIYAQELNKLWGSQVVVDNRPGASGMIAAEIASKAAPDGYTLLVSPQTSIVVAPLIFKKVAYDPSRDFAPISVIGSTPQLLVVHPSLPLSQSHHRRPPSLRRYSGSASDRPAGWSPPPPSPGPIDRPVHRGRSNTHRASPGGTPLFRRTV
jgi:tripartite-type tricarboxylate transporter receptor subunit TctC